MREFWRIIAIWFFIPAFMLGCIVGALAAAWWVSP